MAVSGPERGSLRAALAESFHEEELQMLLDEHLGVSWGNLAQGDSYPARLYSAIAALDRDNRLLELTEVAVAERPRSRELAAVLESLRQKGSLREIPRLQSVSRGPSRSGSPEPSTNSAPAELFGARAESGAEQGSTHKVLAKFRRALEAAYPDRSDLEIALEEQLGKNLNALVTQGDLEEVAFYLVRTARTEGWLPDLWRMAVSTRGENPEIAALAIDPTWLAEIAQFDLRPGRTVVGPSTLRAPEPAAPRANVLSDWADESALPISVRRQHFQEIEALTDRLTALFETLGSVQSLTVCAKIREDLEEAGEHREAFAARRYWKSIRDVLEELESTARSIRRWEDLEQELSAYEADLHDMLEKVRDRHAEPDTPLPEGLIGALDAACARMMKVSQTAVKRVRDELATALERLRAVLGEITVLSEATIAPAARNATARNFTVIEGGRADA